MVLDPAGSNFSEDAGEGRPQLRIDHAFAIAAREVTIAEFRRFRKVPGHCRCFARTDDCPAHEVSWYDAAAYCNWLSEQEGIPKEQWCYVPNKKGQYAEGMKVVPDFLTRSGYRLPTANEWEYACRAGSVTRWSLGEAEDLLPKYAWCRQQRVEPAAPGRRRCGPTTWVSSTCTATPGSGARTGKAAWLRAGRTRRPVSSTTPTSRIFRAARFGHGPLTIQSSEGNYLAPWIGAATWASGRFGRCPEP